MSRALCGSASCSCSLVDADGSALYGIGSPTLPYVLPANGFADWNGIQWDTDATRTGTLAHPDRARVKISDLIDLSSVPGWTITTDGSGNEKLHPIFAGGGSAFPASTAYTPTVTASSGGLNIGTDGSIVGRTSKSGDLRWFSIQMVLGSAVNGMTVGSGWYTFTLPEAPAASIGGQQVVSSFYFDNSAGVGFPAFTKLSTSGGTDCTIWCGSASGINGYRASSTQPVAPDVGDRYSIQGVYQTAAVSPVSGGSAGLVMRNYGPWNASADQGISSPSIDITGSSMTTTGPSAAGRAWKITAKIPIQQLSSTGSPSIYLNVDGTDIVQVWKGYNWVANYGEVAAISWVFTLSAASHTIKLRCTPSGGSVYIRNSLDPAYYVIEDIGTY